jgi:hypothetical protein
MSGHPVGEKVDYSFQLLLGKIGFSSVDVHHPETWFDLDRGRSRWFDTSCEHGRPATRQGQG